MTQEKYTPIVSKPEEELTLRPKSGANYKNIKMITLKSSTTNINQKLAIINEFNLDHNRDIFQQMAEINAEKTPPERKLELVKGLQISRADQSLLASEYGVEEYMERLAEALFLQKIEAKFDDLNLDEVTRALSDFFTGSGSSTESSSKK